MNRYQSNGRKRSRPGLRSKTENRPQGRRHENVDFRTRYPIFVVVVDLYQSLRLELRLGFVRLSLRLKILLTLSRSHHLFTVARSGTDRSKVGTEVVNE